MKEFYMKNNGSKEKGLKIRGKKEKRAVWNVNGNRRLIGKEVGKVNGGNLQL